MLYLMDNGFAANDVGTINRYLGWLIAAAAVFGGFAALRYYLVSWLSERVVADIRTTVYDRVIRMDPTFFETKRTGEVLSRLTADTTLVQSVSGRDVGGSAFRRQSKRVRIPQMGDTRKAHQDSTRSIETVYDSTPHTARPKDR